MGVEIQEGSNTIDLGLLDKEDSLDLACKLLLAARDLSQGYIKWELEELFDKLIENF